MVFSLDQYQQKNNKLVNNTTHTLRTLGFNMKTDGVMS